MTSGSFDCLTPYFSFLLSCGGAAFTLLRARRRAKFTAPARLLLFGFLFWGVISLYGVFTCLDTSTSAASQIMASPSKERRPAARQTAPSAKDAASAVKPATLPRVSYRAMSFYYSWYGNPRVDGKYIHWNHKVLVAGGKSFPGGGDIGADFYPQLGAYRCGMVLVGTLLRSDSCASILKILRRNGAVAVVFVCSTLQARGLLVVFRLQRQNFYSAQRTMYRVLLGTTVETYVASSNDPATIRAHMRMHREAGIGVMVLSWWGRDDFVRTSLDFSSGGSKTDFNMRKIMDIATEYGIKVAFHVEPYEGRSAQSIADDAKYIQLEYGEHPALFRHVDRNDADSRGRPVLFFYDSYKLGESEWAKVFDRNGAFSVRGKPWDVVAIGHIVNAGDAAAIRRAGLDGFYTYFATDGFTYGSSTGNWNTFHEEAVRHGLLFIPSVGPGYADMRIRPFNRANQRSREGGAYYRRMMQAAISSRADYITITSFNEWHEGTQIEPAVRKRVEQTATGGVFQYQDYGDKDPSYYLQLTRELLRGWVPEDFNL